jgi:YHS domain-containing protein
LRGLLAAGVFKLRTFIVDVANQTNKSDKILMKSLKRLCVFSLALAALALASTSFAGDKTPKADNLTTCPVSGEKLGEMGKPLVFTYEDQEVKLCCKSCKKDFDKDPAKYLKLIRAADKK